MSESRHEFLKGAQPNILGQLEPVLSPESLVLQHLEEWGGLIQLWDSEPAHRQFVLSVVDRGSTLWYKLDLHGDNSCIINEVYYSELDHGLSAVATRHGIQRVEPGQEQILLSVDKKRRKSSLKIWRRLSIGTFLKSDSEDKKTSPQKSARAIRRSNSLRLFHPKVTRKFSLKNAHHDTAFKPAEPEDGSLPDEVPTRQFPMPPPAQGPFRSATLPRISRGRAATLPSGSTGAIAHTTDLDSVLTNQNPRSTAHLRRQKQEMDLAPDSNPHKKLTRSSSVDREDGIQAGSSPTHAFGSCPKLSKYARNSCRSEKCSPESQHGGTLSRSGARAYTSPQPGVTWRLSIPTEQRPSRTQELSCPGDRPLPVQLNSRSAARFSVFPIDSSVVKSGSVLTTGSGRRMPGEEVEAPKQICTVYAIRV